MKETPEGAEIPSHVLMLRAGIISQVMAGAYTYMPLGVRALKKAEQIVRRVMNESGAVELLMPALTPISLWERTGRAEAFGNVLIRFDVRRQNRSVSLALGPTHEEVITDLVAHHISSYRQLPLTLYQIQTKFRNEERPRFGVLRTSEFLMKDAYSFDTSLEGLNASYDTMYAAYCKIFDQAGLQYLAVEAESGPIGGDASHEFMVLAENGEDTVVHCGGCGYAANLERAGIATRAGNAAAADSSETDSTPGEIQLVDTPGAGTIEAVCKLLGCEPRQMIKSLIYLADGKPLAVLVRGDHEVNEAKLRRAAGAGSLELADAETIQQVTGAPVGFAGPVGLKIPLWADEDVRRLGIATTGANQADKHYRNVQQGRDYTVADDHFTDLRNATPGDPCPRCGEAVSFRHAIEVGHVFKLGTKYSDALHARFLDDSEQQHSIIMGCYGIGVNRIIASAIETSHDEHGIIWPMRIAPYQVLICPLNVSQEDVVEVVSQLEAALTSDEIEVLVDDRDARAGVKFKDADLIGIPLRIVVGQRGLKAGKLEARWRWESEAFEIDLDSAAQEIASLVRAEMANPTHTAGVTGGDPPA
jgi:prolyl-tRNA synthetase